LMPEKGPSVERGGQKSARETRSTEKTFPVKKQQQAKKCVRTEKGRARKGRRRNPKKQQNGGSTKPTETFLNAKMVEEGQTVEGRTVNEEKGNRKWAIRQLVGQANGPSLWEH